MALHQGELRAVPTNIITGFLGVGKTSAILHLLKAKPESERWAVLVNEFGEIGVDGSLFAGQASEEQGVFIREVPGGCMCCAAGLPMQIALSQLLSRAKPDRLLIEPTGLGHPFEVLEVLSSDINQQVLDLQKTLTLVDARKLSDSRYTEHATFNQQIAMADLVIGNKQDQYQASDKAALVEYVKEHGRENVGVEFTEFGKIDPSLLTGKTAFLTDSRHHHHAHGDTKPLASELPIPDTGYLKAENQGEGFQSAGWRFASDKVFDRQKLFSLLSGLNVERMKAVFITDEGIFAYNLADDILTEVELDDCMESRIETIYREADNEFESRLMNCLNQADEHHNRGLANGSAS